MFIQLAHAKNNFEKIRIINIKSKPQAIPEALPYVTPKKIWNFRNKRTKCWSRKFLHTIN